MFIGEEKELGNNVHTYNEARQAERCTKTTESILKFIQRKFTGGQDIVDALNNGVHLDPDSYKPRAKLGSDNKPIVLDDLEMMILSGEVKQHLIRARTYKDNCNKVYGLILGQCTRGVMNKLESEKSWDATSKKHDPIELLKLIKQVTLNYQDSKYTYKSIFKTVQAFHTVRQHEGETLIDYVKRFKILKDLMEIHHGPLTFKAHILNDPALKPDKSNRAELKKVAYDKYVAYMFIQGLDPKRHRNLATELDNQHALGDDKFPKDLSAAVSQAAYYKDIKRIDIHHVDADLDYEDDQSSTASTSSEDDELEDDDDEVTEDDDTDEATDLQDEASTPEVPPQITQSLTSTADRAPFSTNNQAQNFFGSTHF